MPPCSRVIFVEQARAKTHLNMTNRQFTAVIPNGTNSCEHGKAMKNNNDTNGPTDIWHCWDIKEDSLELLLT